MGFLMGFINGDFRWVFKIGILNQNFEWILKGDFKWEF